MTNESELAPDSELGDELEAAVSKSQTAETMELVAHYDRELASLVRHNWPKILSALRTPSYAQGLEDAAKVADRFRDEPSRSTCCTTTADEIGEAIEAIRALPKDSHQFDALREAYDDLRRFIYDKTPERRERSIERFSQALATISKEHPND